MTKAHDIRELIAEQSSGPGERQAMETMASRLDESLTREVPFRPEFKVQLRQQLVAGARRTLMPWYRRPAVWAPSLGVAAAAAVLAVGLKIYDGAPGGPQPQSVPRTAEAPQTGPGEIKTASPEQPYKSFWVNQVLVPAVVLPDEVLPPGAAAPVPESVAGVDLSQGLKVFALGSMPDMAQFMKMAAGLGFSQEPQRSGPDFTVAAGARSLYMTTDGNVNYTDRTVTPETGAVTDAVGARVVAQRFLDTASLPVPSLQPAVAEGKVGGERVFTVTYTPLVEGRPVANARTVITVTERSRVLRADAYVYAREQEAARLKVITPDQALAEATRRGGARFGPEADLVYVRTVNDQAVYLQPSWRVFGTTDAGGRLIRYVPAVAQQ